MGDFLMPSLGADMDEGTIVEWRIAPGDVVRRGDIVAVVDTAKAAIEIEAFEDGVVEEILVGTGVLVPVGTPLARIVTVGGGAEAEPAGPALGVAPPLPGMPAAPGPGPLGPAGSGLPFAPPPVRRLALQLGVDLSSVTGTGQDGHVTHEDVMRAADAGDVRPAPKRPTQAAPTRAAPTAASVASAPSVASAAAGASPAAAPSAATSPPAATSPAAPPPRATPRARRLAAEKGLDLGRLSGSGTGAAILGADVERAAAAPATGGTPSVGAGAVPPAGPGGAPPGRPGGVQPGAVQPGGVRPPPADDRRAAMRAAIASLMARSAAEIPHYYVAQTLDLAAALAWLRAHNADLPAQRRVLRAALFLRATVLAAQAVPDLNGHWIDGALHPADHVDLGVAVATRGGGLVTPAIPDAQGLGIDDLMARLADLVRRARGGTLRQAEMAGGTITVSSLGETGPDALYGVIFPPQVALVGLGGIVERPWAVNGMLTVRPTVTVTLAADHRASDGRTASAFLAAFAHALDHPEEL